MIFWLLQGSTDAKDPEKPKHTNKEEPPLHGCPRIFKTNHVPFSVEETNGLPHHTNMHIAIGFSGHEYFGQ